MREAGVGDARAAELHPLEAGQLRHMLQAGVGHEGAASEIEYAELLQRHEMGEPGVGEVVVEQDQLFEPGDARHRLERGVGQVR